MSLSILKENVNKKIKELQILVLNNFNIKLNVNIEYTISGYRILGTFDYRYNSIALYPDLLEEFGDIYIEDVVVHEYAHAVVFALYGNNCKPHGQEFKKICKIFNITGKATTNSFKNSNILKIARDKKQKIKKRYEYKCDCGTHSFTQYAHNMVKNKGARYICKSCKSLIFINS